MQSLSKVNENTILQEEILICVKILSDLVFSSVQSFSHARLFLTPWTTLCQASLSITSSQSLPKLMSIKLVMPFNHLILCHPLLLPPSIFPSMRVFSNESVLRIRLPNNNFKKIYLYTICFVLNCPPPKRYVEILFPSIYECDLTWK